MTKKEWCPFKEADNNLDKYSYFFDDKELCISSTEHPQVMEDFMHENCPQNFCYVMIRKDFYDSNIVGRLIGLPKDVALAIKLMRNIDLIDSNLYEIRKAYYGDFVMFPKND